LAPVFRTADEPVPVLSIVHWKLGHYAAILKPENGGYLVKDPVLGRQTRWMPAGAIAEEASGYFLAPAGEIQKTGWRRVDGEEAGQVLRRGGTTGPTSTNGGPQANGTSGSGCGGMCGYNIAELAVAVTLSDQPVGYTPAIGPSAKVAISYNQREIALPTNINHFNVSPNWTTNWLRFIQDDPTKVGNKVMRYFADGDVWFYSYNSATGFVPEESDQSVLTLISTNPITYQRALQDGSIEAYGESDGSTSYPRNVFLTQIKDPQGNTLTLKYTKSGGQVVLSSLTDATGRDTHFLYNSPQSPLLISQITDPFLRSAYLQYNDSGQLESITDVLGIASTFHYNSSGLVDAMTTPYGTTQFDFGGKGNKRFVDVTDPLGLHEREENPQPGHVTPVDTNVPSGMTTVNQFLDVRDSFHWDKHEYAVAGCSVKDGCPTGPGPTNAYPPSRVTPISITTRTTLRGNGTRSRPSSSRWTAGPGTTTLGQPEPYSNGTHDQPSQIGRLLTGGATQLWQKSYNPFGNPTQVIDPIRRTTNLTYNPNNLIDLIQFQQVVGSSLQTTASYGNYIQHRPQTYIDAAGQVTQYVYNAQGQLKQLTGCDSKRCRVGSVWIDLAGGLG
jgi:YD repeat-containing protein